MRNLKTTLFIIALVILSTQTFRHVYVKFIGPIFLTSVLDKFDSELQVKVNTTNNINELVDMYSKKKDEISAFKADNSNYKQSDEYQLLVKEIDIIKNKIDDVEEIQKEKSKLVVYWLFGLLSICLGIIMYLKVNKWIGISGVITGFSEMIVWTSPIFDSFSTFNFSNYLTTILILSIISLLLINLLWILNEKYIDKENKIQ